MRSKLILSIALAFAGCKGSGSGAIAPDKSFFTGSRCFSGHTVAFDAKGTAIAQTEVYLHRTMKPEAQTIVDELVSYDKPGAPPSLYRVTRKVDGNQFTLSDEYGSMQGTGILEGDPWGWTGWSEDLTIDEGQKVVGQEQFLVAGANVDPDEENPPEDPNEVTIHTERKLYDKSFQLLMVFREVFRPKPEADCVRRIEEAAKAAKGN